MLKVCTVSNLFALKDTCSWNHLSYMLLLCVLTMYAQNVFTLGLRLWVLISVYIYINIQNQTWILPKKWEINVAFNSKINHFQIHLIERLTEDQFQNDKIVKIARSDWLQISWTRWKWWICLVWINN